MEIKRIGSQTSGKGPSDWFTGTVRIDPLFDAPDPARDRWPPARARIAHATAGTAAGRSSTAAGHACAAATGPARGCGTPRSRRDDARALDWGAAEVAAAAAATIGRANARAAASASRGAARFVHRRFAGSATEVDAR